MIKGINQSGRYITISGGVPPGNYFTSFSGQTMVGQLRWNPSTQNTEVYDGNNWQTLGTTYASVGLTPQAETAIDWALQKIREEQELDELCKQHPSVAEAYERLQILKTLTKQSDTKKD